MNRAKAVCSVLPENIELLVDVGCDGGTLTKFIADCAKPRRIIGYDINEASIEYARRTKPGIEFYVADARSLPLGDGVADVVTMLEVLEHMPNPEKALSEAHRVLKPGGRLIILVPNEKSLLFRVVWAVWVRTFGRAWRDAHDYKFDLDRLKDMVSGAGFRVEELRLINFGMIILLIGVKP